MTKEFKIVFAFTVFALLVLIGLIVKIEMERLAEWENVDILNKYSQ